MKKFVSKIYIEYSLPLVVEPDSRGKIAAPASLGTEIAIPGRHQKLWYNYPYACSVDVCRTGWEYFHFPMPRKKVYILLFYIISIFIFLSLLLFFLFLMTWSFFYTLFPYGIVYYTVASDSKRRGGESG